MKTTLLAAAAALLVAAVAAATYKAGVGPTDAERIAAAEAVVARLKDACSRFRADTGAYAIEYVQHPESVRRLSAPQALPGYRGPYLVPPLAFADAAIAARLHVVATTTLAPNESGYDLDGDGVFETTGPGNVLRFEYAEAHWSLELDRRIDAGVAGDWRVTGRVRFFADRPGKPGTLDVLLLP